MFLPKPTSFQGMAPGAYEAIFRGFVYLGTQKNTYKGEAREVQQVCILLEFPDKRTQDGKPMIDSPIYSFTMGKKSKLRAHLEGARGKQFTDSDLGPGGFNLKNIAGVRVMVTYGLKEEGEGTNIKAMTPSGLKPMRAKTENPMITLGLSPEDFNQQVFDSLNDFLKGKIMTSPEYRALKGFDDGHHVDDAPDYANDGELVKDEIPF